MRLASVDDTQHKVVLMTRSSNLLAQLRLELLAERALADRLAKALVSASWTADTVEATEIIAAYDAWLTRRNQ